MSDVRVFALPVLMLLLPTHPRGIKFPFWVLRVRPPSTDPFNISRGMYTLELASVFRARDAGPGNKLKSSSRENYYTTSNKYNFVKFRHLLYTRRSRSFRHNIIPQPFSGVFSVHDGIIIIQYNTNNTIHIYFIFFVCYITYYYNIRLQLTSTRYTS